MAIDVSGLWLPVMGAHFLKVTESLISYLCSNALFYSVNILILINIRNFKFNSRTPRSPRDRGPQVGNH